VAYTFDNLFAADPSNPTNVASNASILLYDPADPTKAPVTITDPTGSPIPNPVTVNKNGFGPAMQHATLDRLAWEGGGFSNFITSYEGIKNEAVSARTAAQEAAATAGTDAAAVADAAIGTATDEATAAAAAAEAAAAAADASALAAANSAALVGAPADNAIATAINASGSATKTALSATIATAVEAVRPNNSGAFGAITEALGDGVSASIVVMGDSTGNDPGEWVDLMARDLGAMHPTCRVQMKTWDGTAEKLGAWSVLQAGSAGERHAIIPQTTPRALFTKSADITAPTGDLDIRVKVALDDWTPAALATLAARYGVAGSRSWSLSIAPTGNRIQLDWSPDGTTMLALAPPPNLPVVADGATKWVRFTLDVDNGAGGYTGTSYLSDDGQTWTQVGQSVTSAGTTSVYGGGTQDYEIGGRAITSQTAPGKYYEVQIRNGIDGPVVNPQPIDTWTRVIASDMLTTSGFGGSPTLYVINGSQPGADLAYLTDTVRLPKLFHPMPGALVFLNCSHNDRENVGTILLSKWDTALTALRARIGSTAVFCVITQNPQLPPIELALAQNNARRRRDRLTWAARNALYAIDTYKAFLDDPRGAATLLKTDGIHPTVDTTSTTAQTGSRLWADTVLAAFKAGI
jgi:hypothetical protein